jgi:hypothetical protein
MTDRSVIVADLGGFAGASCRFNNAKISFVYRADFFFNAIDGGFDKPKSHTLGFSVPASVLTSQADTNVARPAPGIAPRLLIFS